MKARTYTNNETKSNREEQPVLTVSSYSVKSARTIQGGIVMADLEINGLTVYGCKVLANNSTGEAFLAWPSTKGRDNKYYHVVYARISDGDQEMIISKIYEWLDANNG